MMPIELGKPPLFVVATGADEAAWHAGRDEGVTASEIHRIARGSRGTWRSILADKLNGSTFHGNRHTRRGHEREEFLIAWANDVHGGIRANRALFGHRDHTRHRATPDGLGWSSEVGSFGVEVKSHEYGHDVSKIPQPHFDQMQFGMWVLGYDAWLYVVEVMGEDGTPTLEEPTARWVTRDANRITYLASQADEFLAWRDAGAPALDDIPEDLDEALAQWAIARDEKTRAAAEEALQTTQIRRWLEANPDAVDGIKRAGSRAHFTFGVKNDTVLDEASWAAAEPESYAEWQRMSAAVVEQAETAKLLYSRPTRSTRLNIYANREQA